jgi:hypothetical protein
MTYGILHAILQQGGLTMAKTTLSDDWGLTTYQINKYFEAINADLHTISQETPIYLDETQRGVWHANSLTTYALQRLGLLYLQRSNAFLVFEYRFLYSQQQSKRDYIDSHAISTPVFYATSTELDKLLHAAGFFTASGDGAEDAEYTLRLHLFELYYTAYTGVTTPFPSMNAVVEELLQLCADFIGAPLRPTQITKLSLFLKLWLLRVKNGGTLAADRLDPTLLDKPAQAFLQRVQRLLADKQPVSARETNYLYTFMITQGLAPAIAPEQLRVAFPAAARLSRDFIQALQSQGELIDRSRLNTSQLHISLDSIHLQFTTFFIEPTTFIDPTQVSFFQDLYPGFDAVITGFIQDLQQAGTFALSQNMAVNLYFSYMFALISAIPPRALNDVVAICVDFSQGVLYSDYVIQTLAAFSHAHIVIEDNASDTTDIYISDFHSDLVDRPQVIWQNPPTPNDWTNLADMILAIKQEKTKGLLQGRA